MIITGIENISELLFKEEISSLKGNKQWEDAFNEARSYKGNGNIDFKKDFNDRYATKGIKLYNISKRYNYKK